MEQNAAVGRAWADFRTATDRVRRRLAADFLGVDGRGAMRLLGCPLEDLVAAVLYAVGGRSLVGRLRRQGWPVEASTRYETRSAVLRLLRAHEAWGEVRAQAAAFIRCWRDDGRTGS